MSLYTCPDYAAIESQQDARRYSEMLDAAERRSRAEFEMAAAAENNTEDAHGQRTGNCSTGCARSSSDDSIGIGLTVSKVGAVGRALLGLDVDQRHVLRTAWCCCATGK